MSRVGFFIQEALRALRRSAAPSVAAIVTIVVTVLLLGVLIPVLQTTQGKTEEVREQIQLKVFLYDDATKQEIERLSGRISDVPHVTSAEFVSKQEALEILRARLEDDDIIEELNSNPLPASFNVNLDDPDNLETVRSDLAPPNEQGQPEPISPVIEEVIYARRREVEVMRLVGATNWFIRWPFIIEGLVVGLLGAGCAVAILWLGKVTIVDPLSERFALVAAQNTIQFLPLVAILVACAMAVSALGSGFTLRRFLR